MPPRVKITKEDIISTATRLTRNNGIKSLNARSIADELNCSTQPIFSNFKNMEELENQVKLTAYNLFWDFINNEIEKQNYPKYKSFGMAYIRFAKEEKELFKLLCMSERKGESIIPTTDFDQSVQIIMDSNGVSREIAELMHVEMWVFVHGIAVMTATSFLTLDWNIISNMITDVYQGIRITHVKKEN